MATIDKRKVVLKYLYGNVLNSHFLGRPNLRSDMYFSLLIGNYKYGITNEGKIVRAGHDDDRCGWAVERAKEYYYTFCIPGKQIAGLKRICSSNADALLLSRIDGLGKISKVKLKFFPDNKITLNINRWQNFNNIDLAREICV